jgi:hydroxyethylthiazole kinase
MTRSRGQVSITSGEISEALKTLRQNHPLVHHITNYVTVNDCANITMCIGAAPVMAEAREEVVDMVALAGALVLNIGTLRAEQVDAMLLAGKKANELDVPIILDPVGAGATPYRTEVANLLLDKLDIAVLKGNAGEIGVLSGSGGRVLGVDSHGMDGDALTVTKDFAARRGGIVVMSGATDIISDGRRTYLVDNGHPLMASVSGTGCMATSLAASFAATVDDHLLASVAALACFGIAGENAARRGQGPASFKVALLDEVSALDPQGIEGRCKVREA